MCVRLDELVSVVCTAGSGSSLGTSDGLRQQRGQGEGKEVSVAHQSFLSVRHRPGAILGELIPEAGAFLCSAACTAHGRGRSEGTPGFCSVSLTIRTVRQVASVAHELFTGDTLASTCLRTVECDLKLFGFSVELKKN